MDGHTDAREKKYSLNPRNRPKSPAFRKGASERWNNNDRESQKPKRINESKDDLWDTYPPTTGTGYGARWEAAVIRKKAPEVLCLLTLFLSALYNMIENVLLR